jgi:hypothetical protein
MSAPFRTLAPSVSTPLVRCRRALILGMALLAAAGLWPASAAQATDAEHAAVEARLAADVKYLASDELEGRGLGTKGIDLAADYIAQQFAEAGLRTEVFDGSPFQTFPVTTKAEPGKNNRLTLVGPAGDNGKPPLRIELKSGEDFLPLSASGSGKLDVPVVFVGYGISAEDKGYDDYAGLDVKGKAVIVLRHEPQQEDPESVFDGKKDSVHAPFERKISNAYQRGAAAVIFCTDELELDRKLRDRYASWQRALAKLTTEAAGIGETKEPDRETIQKQRERIDNLLAQVERLSEQLAKDLDPVLPFGSTGGGSPRDVPVVHCRRGPVDKVLRAALDTDLGTLEEQIDEGPTPHSRELAGWRVTGQVEVERKTTPAKNVVAVLPGEGDLADETVVVGAHYDHLGYGGYGSLEPRKKAIHNGADDNASGVTAIIELARQMRDRLSDPHRRVVFVAFTGEERGLLGSAHYVREPPFPIESTVAMINLDMVGRLRDDKLIVMGTGTAKQFNELLAASAKGLGLKLAKRPGGFGPSDQASFYARKVPVLHFFTGTHKHYHRPSDDFELLNVPGMRRVVQLLVPLATALATDEARPEYVAVKMPNIRQDGKRPYLGTIPDFGGEGTGYVISGVAEGGPAEQAGLQGGDAIIRFGESKIGGLVDIDAALRKYKAGDRVRAVVLRGGKEMTFEITLDPPR